MALYKTGNPVPSSAMPDAWDNNATIDKFVNSTEMIVVTRTGVERDTLAVIQKKSDDQRVQMAEDGAAVVEETRQNLIPLSRQYLTLEAAQADIANIPPGSTTYVRSTDGISLADEYINNAGTLQPTGRKMPSQAAVDGAVILAGSANDATAGLITALESLALLFAQTTGDISDIQAVARENSDAVTRVLTAYELLSNRVANVPEELARIQLNFGFSLDIILETLFKLSKYDFDSFITSGDIPATIKPMGQLTYIPDLSDINAFISYGQSLSNGGGAGNSAISTTQPYSNLTYSSGPVGTTFTATKPLVESGPETICSGMSNYASLSMLRDDGVKPEDHVIFSGAPGQCGCLVAVIWWKISRGRSLGAWVGHMKSVNFAKYCKQRMLVAISSH